MDRQRILLVVEYPNRKGQAVAAESLQERQDTVGMVLGSRGVYLMVATA